MAIKYKKGDVIKALERREIDALAHGCNCLGNFGSGIARQIADKWPFVKDLYLKEYKSKKCILGNVHVIVVAEGAVINCYTQQKYGKKKELYLDYDALHTVVWRLYRISKAYKKRIGISKICTGLVDDDWCKIETIINDIFKDEDIFVYLTDYRGNN